MAFNVPFPDDHDDVRSAVRALCAKFPSEYWRKVDEARVYPEEFVNALTWVGWLAALIPEEYGASLMRFKTAWLHDCCKACGGEANMAKPARGQCLLESYQRVPADTRRLPRNASLPSRANLE